MANYAVGSDGNVSLPAGFNAVLNTWSATIARTSQVTTGFGASVHNRRSSGVIDITGSAGGLMKRWDGADTGSEGGFAPIKHSGTNFDDRAGGQITLTVAPSCTLQFDAVFNSFAFNVTNDGDSTITFNFELNDTTPSFAWDE
jgi:hypothetical protein